MTYNKPELVVLDDANSAIQGVKIEEAATWLERISGKIEVENLYPSWLVFGDGFRRSTLFRMVRRVISSNFLLRNVEMVSYSLLITSATILRALS